MSIAQPGGIAPAAPTRHTVAQLATGGFLLLAGALFATPFLLNDRAQGNDVFLTNLFLAPLIALLGSLLYILALRRLGLSIPLVLILILVNLAVLTSWLWLPQVPTQGVALAERVFAALPVILIIDAALQFLVGALVAGAHGQWGVWSQGLVLTLVASVALAAIYYFFGGQYLAFGETSSSLPPYLNTTALVAMAALAALAYLLGWLWSHE